MARMYLDGFDKWRFPKIPWAEICQHLERRWIVYVRTCLVASAICFIIAIVKFNASQITTWQVGPGWVRDTARVYYQYGDGIDVTLETEEGMIYRFGICTDRLDGMVWKGMHGIIFLDGCHVVKVQHLPPDIVYEEKKAEKK